MKPGLPPANNSGTAKVILLLSIIVCLFIIAGQTLDVYHFAVTGAIFEILWLPCLALTFILPILAIVFLVKEKFTLRSFYLYSILIFVLNMLLLFLG